MAASDQHSTTPASGDDWQRLYAEAVTDPTRLLRLLDLPPALLQGARTGHRLFPLRVPRGFIRRMQRANPEDPLLRQVLPLEVEDAELAGFVDDPVGDLDAMPVPGLLHKYHGRVLLVATGACAVNCRYCFRRHFPYAEASGAGRNWSAALAYIRNHRDVEEVILSGGDPLVLADHKLTAFAEELADIEHVRRLRVHSRLPVVLPERITGSLLDWFTGTRLQPVMVLHANHGNELDDSVASACARLTAAGAPLLNQAVLLRGVNDSVDALEHLSKRLFACGVTPYYLHLLDPVRGAAHFRVPVERARRLAADLSRRLPGYMVPRLVREDAGQPAKTPLSHPLHD